LAILFGRLAQCDRLQEAVTFWVALLPNPQVNFAPPTKSLLLPLAISMVVSDPFAAGSTRR
jgi:hypothetical protein